MTPRDDEIAQYATAVRAALDDLPEADREELVEDLEDHLAEVVAESAEPLTARLGTPHAYAAELRTAYGTEGGGTKRSLRAATLANLDLLERRLKEQFESHQNYRRIWDFFAELRPAWWLMRGYLATMLLWYLWDGHWHVQPGDITHAALAILLTLGSVALGIRARDRRERRLRLTLVGANVVAVLGLLVIWSEVGTSVIGIEPQPVIYASDSPGPAESPQGLGGAVNIYPYSKDGKPLKDVLLYDQDGRPIQLPYGDQGYVIDQKCGNPPPIANSYPLPLKQPEEEQGLEPSPTCAPTSATPAPRPSESPTKTPSPSPSPTKTG